MRCEKIKSLFPAFLDGQLSEKLVLKVKGHLEKCLLCSQELNLLKETWNLLGEWKQIPPSSNFKANFWQRVVEELSLKKQPVFFFPQLARRLIPAFATLGIILIVGIYLVNLSAGISVQHLIKLAEIQDIHMLKDLELTEEFEVIQNIEILEDFEIINSLEL